MTAGEASGSFDNGTGRTATPLQQAINDAIWYQRGTKEQFGYTKSEQIYAFAIWLIWVFPVAVLWHLYVSQLVHWIVSALGSTFVLAAGPLIAMGLATQNMKRLRDHPDRLTRFRTECVCGQSLAGVVAEAQVVACPACGKFTLSAPPAAA